MESASNHSSENKYTKHISIGILAHVDAGKTTLSESLLYLTGSIRKLGRVDHRDAFLDTYEMERDRGITIFSKQAVFPLGEKQATLLDTPGHVDFSAETERTLQVLDYAILVISGADGVQGHARTLWRLLKQYEIPVFLFINKMDQQGTDRERLLRELRESLDEGCIAFQGQFSGGEKSASDGENPALSGENLAFSGENPLSSGENPVSGGKSDFDEDAFFESLAMCGEAALEEYLESGRLSEGTIAELIRERKVFPCYFGSALKVEGVSELLDGLERYTHPCAADPSGAFAARVYKISRDAGGNRLTHMKITGGCLRVKDVLTDDEKVNQIRIYSGEKFEAVPEAEAGRICAVTGLSGTYAGQGLGAEKSSFSPLLEPVLSYEVRLPEGCDVHRMLAQLRQLEEEEPLLRIVWNGELKEIHAQLMGEVQIEILERLIRERFGVDVTFGAGNIVYRETIRTTVEGVGHFEPLRHYAEVHLILEPAEPGSGLTFDTICSEDMLDRNWQRLILTHLGEKVHRGVLTGSALTDVKITLAAGRAHLKHTEGGDFRQSTYRAVRQGLMQAESVLLEPWYAFRLEVPAGMVGRAMTDIQRMSGESEPPQTEGEMAVLVGSAPAVCLRDYQSEVAGYTKGRGRLSLDLKGYEPCHNAEEVIEAFGYDPDRDTDNPSGSVFCAHGAGINVPWNEVAEHMHIESQLRKREASEASGGRDRGTDVRLGPGKEAAQMPAWNAKEERELEEIFIRTYGKYETRRPSAARTVSSAEDRQRRKKERGLKEYLLVDGYNVIFAWDELKELAKDNIESARGRLQDILCNYQAFRKCEVILVFDAYKVEGNALEIQRYHNIHVVFTRQAETADQYIEKVVHEIGRKYHVTVVTSDGVEQVVTLGQGGTLISAREFYEEVRIVREEIKKEYESRRERGKKYLFDSMGEDFAREMERIRLGETE